MSKKKKEVQPVQPMQPVVFAEPPPIASWRRMNNCFPVPVARPADHIQLTPVIQPIPLVPYSTQEQPFLFEMRPDGQK